MLTARHCVRTPTIVSRRELLAMGIAIGGHVQSVAAQTASAAPEELNALLQRQTQQLMDAIACFTLATEAPTRGCSQTARGR